MAKASTKKKAKQKTILIVDGDPYAFQAALRHEQADDWGDGIFTAYQDVRAAVSDASRRINELAKKFKAEVAFCLSDYSGFYFRNDLGSYKAVRKAAVRPLCVRQIKEGLAERFDTYQWPKLEGDDVIGILMTDEKFKPGYRKIMVSIDKDMKTIPGEYFNPDKDEEPTDRSQADADLFFYSQCIAGDVTDGYTGAPGFGMETARKLLEKGVALEKYTHTLTRGPRTGQTEERTRERPSDGPWDTVVSCYEASGLDESDALVNAQMARILTADLWKKKKQKVKLWVP